MQVGAFGTAQVKSAFGWRRSWRDLAGESERSGSERSKFRKARDFEARSRRSGQVQRFLGTDPAPPERAAEPLSPRSSRVGEQRFINSGERLFLGRGAQNIGQCLVVFVCERS